METNVVEALSKKERVNVMSLPKELIKEMKKLGLGSQSIRREEFMRG